MLFPQPPQGEPLSTVRRCVHLGTVSQGVRGLGNPEKALSGANGGGQRVRIGTVSAWAGSQMAWKQPQEFPVPTGESGSGALGKSGCLSGLSFLP